MATLSFEVTLINNTNMDFTLGSAHLDDGTWITRPPDDIPAHGQGSWESQADQGFRLGGSVTYNTDLGPISISWTRSLIGTNTLDVRVPRGLTESHTDQHEKLTITISGGPSS